MKIILVLYFLMLSASGFCQLKVVTGKEAAKFEGQTVNVRDSVYDGKILNDSTAVYYVGAKASQHPLVVLHIIRSPNVLSGQPDRYIKALQRGKVNFNGKIFIVEGIPMAIIRGVKEFGIEVKMPYHSGKP